MKMLYLLGSLIFAFQLFAQNFYPNEESMTKRPDQYLNQKMQESIELFAPELIASPYHELNAVFNCDFTEFYFARRGVPQKPSTLMVCRYIQGQWQTPEVLSISGQYDDIDMMLINDGQSLIFCSNRPLTSGEAPLPYHNFWITQRTSNGWAEPELFAPKALSEQEDFYPIVTRSGNLYFNSQREGHDTNNIYCSQQMDGVYQPAEKLPEPINSSSREFDAYISPDENVIIFASERSGGHDGSDLYISIKDQQGYWSNPENLGPEINSYGWEFGAMISPDNRYLLFTSTRTGREKIHCVSISNIPLLNQYFQNRAALSLSGPGSYHIHQHQQPLIIPFTMERGKPCLAAKLNDKPVRMLIDNGSLWDELFLFDSPQIEALQLLPAQDVQVGGSGEGDAVTMYATNNLQLSFPGIDFIDQPGIVAQPGSGFAQMFSADGQVSSLLFKHFIVDFNWSRQEITLHQPDSFIPPTSHQMVAMQPIDSDSYALSLSIEINPDSVIMQDFMIDLGYTRPLSLCCENLDIMAANIQEEVTGYGVQGEIRGKVLTAKLREWNGQSNQEVSIVLHKPSSGKHSKIGLPLLSQQNIIFDYFHKRVYLYSPYSDQ